MAQPAIDAQGFLPFGETAAPATVADDLSVGVSPSAGRHPLQMETVLRLRVAGRDREVLLGSFIGWLCATVVGYSAACAHRIDGRLRVQLRAGEWELVLHAREGQPRAFQQQKWMNIGPPKKCGRGRRIASCAKSRRPVQPPWIPRRPIYLPRGDKHLRG